MKKAKHCGGVRAGVTILEVPLGKPVPATRRVRVECYDSDAVNRRVFRTQTKKDAYHIDITLGDEALAGSKVLLLKSRQSGCLNSVILLTRCSFSDMWMLRLLLSRFLIC